MQNKGRNLYSPAFFVLYYNFKKNSSDFWFNTYILFFKLILTLISTIKKTDLSFEEKTIHIDDLPFFDSETRNNVYIDESCKEIMKKPIKINGFYYNWFIKIGYKNGFIHYQFHEDLIPYLLELKSNFTMYNLENVIKLNSNYLYSVNPNSWVTGTLFSPCFVNIKT